MEKFSERNVIKEISLKQAGVTKGDLIKGIGDDCAVIQKAPGHVELWTTDTLVEGVHFDLAHRNRIDWEEDKLDEFRVALENRIKAVIV